MIWKMTATETIGMTSTAMLRKSGPRMTLAMWPDTIAKPMQAGSMMASRNSRQSSRWDRAATGPWLALTWTTSGMKAAEALTAGMISDCRTRSTPALYWPAAAGPMRWAMMKRSITLDNASSVSDTV